MRLALGILALSAHALLVRSLPAQTRPYERSPTVALTVPSGSPLRLYLTKRVSKRADAPVQAKLMEPVYAFDREVIPAGTIALGKVSRTQRITKWQRVRAILNGDFTPLRSAQVEFTSLKLPDGHELSTHTVESMGLNSIYIETSAKKKKTQKPQNADIQNPNGGILGTAKQTAKDRIRGAINSRTRGFSDIVRSPNKKEKLVDFLWSKVPYHPQYWRRGTRFDAALRDPLEFGSAAVKQEDLGALGTQPGPDSVAARSITNAIEFRLRKAGRDRGGRRHRSSVLKRAQA